MPQPKRKPAVYLVICDSTRRCLAVFSNEEDAEDFADLIEQGAEVEKRTLWYGQPSVRGYNP